MNQLPRDCEENHADHHICPNCGFCGGEEEPGDDHRLALAWARAEHLLDWADDDDDEVCEHCDSVNPCITGRSSGGAMSASNI